MLISTLNMCDIFRIVRNPRSPPEPAVPHGGARRPQKTERRRHKKRLDTETGAIDARGAHIHPQTDLVRTPAGLEGPQTSY